MTRTLTLINDLSELARLADEIENVGRSHGLSREVVHDIRIALDEVVTNIIENAYEDNGERLIRVQFEARTDAVTITVQDDGKPFNPLDREAPDIQIPFEERPIGGLGIFLVRRLMDHVQYQNHDGFNRLIMKKHLSPKPKISRDQEEKE